MNQVVNPLERINRNALYLLAALSLGAMIWPGWQAGVSVALGGLLAWVNFHWMKRGVDAALGKSGVPASKAVVAGFLGRFVLILGGLFVMIRFSFFSLLGAVLGLSVYVLAGALEALLLLRKH